MMTLVVAGIMAWFGALRLRTYLQYFQQEEYDFARFLVWQWHARAFDKHASIGLLAMLPLAWIQPMATPLMVTIWLVWRGRQEPDPTLVGKKPLVLTQRASRIWGLAGVLAAWVFAALAVCLEGQPIAAMLVLIVMLQLLPLFLGLANALLWPLQQLANRRYLHEAHATLLRLNPTVVSISGAFGKTSTKYLLGQILSAHGPTLISPGSTNTPLGLAQIINAQLQPHHQYFLAEMGAYQIGSIAHICRLYPPHACATTAIGAAHYERFKSLEAVAKAEFEVLDATLAHGGPAVLSIDCIPQNLWQQRIDAAPHIKLVGSDKSKIRKGDYWIKSIVQTEAGLNVSVVHNGQTSRLTCPLYGTTMAPNMATAFALATELGVPKAISAAALASAQGAPHRLQRREENGMTILDDSYNSNPNGFAAALEVLSLIGGAKGKKSSRRKILITPGMVELGTLHDAEHSKIGTLAAQHADVVLAVAPQRIPTFLQAVKAAGGTELLLMPTLQSAFAWLRTHGKTGDVVLLENDLPDLYEAKWKL